MNQQIFKLEEHSMHVLISHCFGGSVQQNWIDSIFYCAIGSFFFISYQNLSNPSQWRAEVALVKHMGCTTNSVQCQSTLLSYTALITVPKDDYAVICCLLRADAWVGKPIDLWYVRWLARQLWKPWKYIVAMIPSLNIDR